MTQREHEQLDDERGIDLLVDGELDEAQRRELLLRLENTPGAWRRCALAFLEAQAWQEGSQAWVTEPKQASDPPVVAPLVRSSFWQTTWGNLLAVAASFGVAFALGTWYRSNDGGTVNVVVDGAGLQTVPDQGARLAGDPSATPNNYVTLVVDGVADGESNQVRLPVRDWSHVQEIAQQPAAIPESLVEQIEQSGHAVRQQRQLVPVDLQDGRRMIVPMDEVRIVPVSRTFQ